MRAGRPRNEGVGRATLDRPIGGDIYPAGYVSHNYGRRGQRNGFAVAITTIRPE